MKRFEVGRQRARSLEPLLGTRCAYTHVVDAQTGILSQLFACTMPPTQGVPAYGIAPGTVIGIDSVQKQTIVDWIGCGAPDN